jgi:putative FmdB family regulatory protein
MPTYEYECQKCAHHFEVIQSMNDAPLKRCPKCRGRVKRLVGTGAGLIFKGSGFYSTDYRKPGYTEAAKKDSAPTTTPATAKDAGTAKAKDSGAAKSGGSEKKSSKD